MAKTLKTDATEVFKATSRIPTVQFGYIEIEHSGAIEDIVEEHRLMLRSYQGGEGLPDKDFNRFLDTYLNSNKGELEVYNKMSPEQQNIIQTIKRSLKRITYNENKTTQN